MHAAVKMKIRNSSGSTRTVFLEPITSELKLADGKTVDVTVEGDLAFSLEIEVDTNRIVVYTFDSKGARIYFSKEPD